MKNASVVCGLCVALGLLGIPAAWYVWMAEGFNVYHGAGTHFVILVAAAGFLLPAATFGRKFPISAGLWLLGGVAVCFFWRLSAILDVKVNDYVRSEVWQTIFWICGPLLLLGLGFLRDHDKVIGSWRKPPRKP